MLDEKKVETLNQAAVLADDYILTHKSLDGCRPQPSPYPNQYLVEPFYPDNNTRKQLEYKGNPTISQKNAHFHPDPFC